MRGADFLLFLLPFHLWMLHPIYFENLFLKVCILGMYYQEVRSSVDILLHAAPMQCFPDRLEQHFHRGLQL